MNNMDIETDAVEVMEKFRKFTSQEMKKRGRRRRTVDDTRKG